jgi:hypothetical protein
LILVIRYQRSLDVVRPAQVTRQLLPMTVAEIVIFVPALMRVLTVALVEALVLRLTPSHAATIEVLALGAGAVVGALNRPLAA